MRSSVSAGATLGVLLGLCCGCLPLEKEGSLDTARVTEGLVVCADGETLDGIDVSHWQGTIDWDAVAASGIAFAFIRVGDGLGLDREFDRNWTEAKRVGLIRGVYQYFRPSTDPVAQAEHLLDTVGPLDDEDLPPVLDVETSDEATADEIVEGIRSWVTVIETATRRTPVFYSGRFWREVVRTDEFDHHPLWVPHWGVDCPNIPDAWADWAFWQTSATGDVPGIAGNVDTDVWNGDLASLRAFAADRIRCGDGRCNADETQSSCPADCPRCEPIPPLGRVVDEVEVCFEAGGDPRWWREEEAGYGGRLLWTHTTDNEASVSSCLWELDFESAGLYRLEAYTDAAWAESTLAAYEVRHEGRTDVTVVDQTSVDGWSPIDDLLFAEGGDQWVFLGDNTGEPNETDTRVVCDALRLTRLDPPEDGGPGDAGPRDGDVPPDDAGPNVGDADGGATDAGAEGRGDAGPEADDDSCGCRAAGSRGAARLGLEVLLRFF